jgi:hypothetical protein
MQPIQNPVLLSNLQMSIHGESMLMSSSPRVLNFHSQWWPKAKEPGDYCTRHASGQSDCVNKADSALRARSL